MQLETVVCFTIDVVWYNVLNIMWFKFSFVLLLLGVQHSDLPDPVSHWFHCSWYHRVKV